MEALAREVERAHEREQALLKQLAEKDAQIRMVLEERFYHPVQPARNTSVRSTVVMRPEDVEDVVQFPVESDKQEVAKAETRYKEAVRDTEQALDAAIAEEMKQIVAEQEAAHAGQEVQAPEPVEMLERVASAAEPMTKAERSKEAARQIAEAQP